jgi:cytochrome c peroxidase
MNITGRKEDSLKFKVPSLRNVALTFPYMHDGRFWNLEDVYDHYNQTIPLSPVERSLLTEFLKTLTDEKLMNDPELTE